MTTVYHIIQIISLIHKLQQQENGTLSMQAQHQINKMWIGSIYLGKTTNHWYLFQSLHGSHRWVNTNRKDLDGSLWKRPYISHNSPLGRAPWIQSLIFSDHIYPPTLDYVPRVLPNVMIFCVSKKKLIMVKLQI